MKMSMMTARRRAPTTLADLLRRLGDIAPERIRMDPPPGTATEQDILDIHAREKRLCELVDGVLVEKTMGYPESYMAMRIGGLLASFVYQHDLGIVAGADGMVRLTTGLVRIPDVSFVSWDQLPSRQVPADPIPDLAPDLAVEVLSKGNTPGEMKRKLREYFRAGVKLVWFVDMKKRTVQVFTAPDQFVLLTEEQTLDGGKVLPGFSLPLPRLFALVPRQSAKPNKSEDTGRAGKKKSKKNP